MGDKLAIWGGTSDSDSYQRFEFVVVPCNYVHAEYGPTGYPYLDTIPNNCVANKTQQIEYLGNMKMVILTDDAFVQIRDFT